jgi:diguanylate cyclase (GGDEF)-like protein
VRDITVDDDPTIPPRLERRRSDRRRSAQLNARSDSARDASAAERRTRVRRRADRADDRRLPGPEDHHIAQSTPGESDVSQSPFSEEAKAFPTTKLEIESWVREEFQLSGGQHRQLVDGINTLLFRYERLWERSKADAIGALIATFTSQIERLKREISDRDATVSNVTHYFERIVNELTIRASHDPKTRLMNFQRFLEELQAYLALEQRGRWCAVGLVDINSFKWYNDTLGHVVGDQIIERVARLLQEHVRAADIVAHDPRRELHARFGGDEFCFLIPDLDDTSIAASIANRFRDAVGRHDWTREDPRLADRLVTVDVGVACLLLGSLNDRRRMGPELARELLARADRLMYQAKGDRAGHAYPLALRLENMTLVPIEPSEVS